MFALVAGIWLYDSVVFAPLAQLDLPDEEEMKATPPLFIPFPGTTEQLEPQPYRGSDPEWQEFIKFSKDQAEGKRVRGEHVFEGLPACVNVLLDILANYVLTSAESHPILNIRCGKGMKLRRRWLDVDFPQTAPPEFVRSG